MMREGYWCFDIDRVEASNIYYILLIAVKHDATRRAR
jgi:hypothetical protein